MQDATDIVVFQAFAQIIGQSCVESLFVDFTLKDVAVMHRGGLPSRSSLRSFGKQKKVRLS